MGRNLSPIRKGRNLSPVLRRELENLDKDADSRKSAMKALKSYVKDLDSKAIPVFLAQVSETKEPGASFGEYTISLYEVLARVHGRNIVPQIENIMSTILKTLSSSAGSFSLHQACSKVVPAIARYGIDPLTPDDEKTRIICSLCKPLSDVLMGSTENIASGAALCLKALVESDNWRFASDDMVNQVCLKVTGALEEKLTQTNAHMGLVMALSKHNGLIVEAFARSLLRSGLQILTTGAAEANSQRRFSAIQMINFLMKCVDSRSISSELATVIEVMENCHSDRMPFVRGAAFEALQTARTISTQKGSKYERGSSPITGSNFDRGDYRRRAWPGTDNAETGVYGSPTGLASPESQTVDSFVAHDNFLESPMSIGQSSCNLEYARRANRRLWNNENGGVDVSLKDGLLSKFGSAINGSKTCFGQFGDAELNDTIEEHPGTFSGFVQVSAEGMVPRGSTSPRRHRSPLTIEDMKIFSTPRKLIRSLQDPTGANSGCPEKQNSSMLSSPTSGEVDWNPKMAVDGDTHSHNLNCEIDVRKPGNARMLNGENDVRDVELVPDDSESVSSSSDAPPDTARNVPCEAGHEEKNGTQSVSKKKRRFCNAAVILVCGLFLVLSAIILSVMQIDNDEHFFDVVPT